MRNDRLSCGFNPCCPPRFIGPQCPQGATGPRGPTGPQGGRGPAAATIPFSISSMSGSGVEIASGLQGNPEIINFAGFGPPGSFAIQLQPGEWNTGTITIQDSIPYPSSFIMPFSGILRNIHVVFANRSPLFLELGVTMRPFVCIATSNSGNLVFTILQNTITYTEPYIGTGDAEIPKYSLRRGAMANLNVGLSEGTLVGIVIGWRGEGVTSEQFGLFSVSGGLFIE